MLCPISSRAEQLSSVFGFSINANIVHVEGSAMERDRNMQHSRGFTVRVGGRHAKHQFDETSDSLYCVQEKFVRPQ